MPTDLASLLFAGFVLWLLARDAKRRPTVSRALWIPLTWLFIISSKPISIWLGLSPEGSEDDSAVDKVLFVILIGAGLRVLMKRGMKWPATIGFNRWLFIFFLYLGISVLWSEDGFTSFKRWFKDVGNVVMVLVVLSEREPEQAIKALFTRYACLVIPLSVLYIKYYPHLSRRYDRWSDTPAFVGMTTDKNTFGMGLFVCGLSLIWMLIQPRKGVARRLDKLTLTSYVMLAVMMVWLLVKAHSATAIGCTVFGGLILMAVRSEAVRRQVKRLGTYLIGIGALLAFLHASGLWELAFQEFTQLMGRDASLHGRADIWKAVLKEDINPLTGVGFYSFWSLERNQRISEGWYYHLGTAHNGYIETYLNSGLIGVALLFAMLAAATNRIKRDVFEGSRFGTLRLAFLITIVLYCLTESAFDRLVPVWFVLLLVMIEYPRRRQAVAVEVTAARPESASEPRMREPTLAGAGYGSSSGADGGPG